MPAFKLAHIREQGQDMIFIPLDAAFGRLPFEDQTAQIAELQARANSAGLAGLVVACWHELSRWHFLGPPQWRAFFESLPPEWISMNINRELTW